MNTSILCVYVPKMQATWVFRAINIAGNSIPIEEEKNKLNVLRTARGEAWSVSMEFIVTCQLREFKSG
jgi:hypothetical protein